MHRRLLTVLALTATLCLFASSALAQTPSGDGDDRVTGHPYLRHDGGTDQAIQECSSLATSPAPDNIDRTPPPSGVSGVALSSMTTNRKSTMMAPA